MAVVLLKLHTMVKENEKQGLNSAYQCISILDRRIRDMKFTVMTPAKEKRVCARVCE